MQIMGEVINYNNILKAWNRSFVRPTGVLKKQCVSPFIFFPQFLLAPETD